LGYLAAAVWAAARPRSAQAGRLARLPALPVVAGAARGADRGRLDREAHGARGVPGAVGSAAQRQVRSAGRPDRDALVLGARPRPHRLTRLPSGRLPAAL